MAFKTIVAAGLMALSMAFVPTAAEAKTRVVIGIGNGWVGPGFGGCYARRHHRCGQGYGYGYGYGNGFYPQFYYNRPVVRYNDPYYYGGNYRRLSCGAAARIVARSGFNRVVARDCSGRVYAFKARRNGHSVIVQVRAANGRIVDVSRF